ncbi:putative F-box/FBD/LRR-repeat protein At4g03220 [Ananas comosus]|uniref:F-box/FBD/LRR-repeat protein At4g03220 n=1 Tax=Ananas comosus TaxID=4615 RepID=A0A6P5FAA8_ANACO|nr:putative F-box/FBD/LRR-repeat protein At4g03220 [Ananas comosus]
MKEEPATKRRKLNNIQEEEEDEDEKAARKADCISGLPDHLLHEILACLPTSTAVRTSLLSRRWRTLWRTSPDVSFTTGLSPSFVDSALRHRDPAVPLRSFSLVAASANSDRAQLPSWIRRAAASPALERLTVRTYAQNHQHSGIVSPAVIRRHCSFIVIDVFRLRLASLRVLELAFPGGGITHVHWPAAAFLPSLQGLDLANLTLFLAAGDAISSSCPALKYCRLSLFAAATPELDVSCPLLEVFELTTRDGPADDVISICGGSVREVRVRQEIAPSGPAYLKLSAPGLRTLEWVGPLPRSAAVDAAADALVSTLVMRTDSSLVEHDLKKMLLKDGRGRKFSMLKVNRLILPKCCITAALGKLVFDRRNQVNNPSDQEYENLKHLELIAYFGGSSSLGVAFLLKMFSKIETLRVSLSGGCTKDSPQSEDFYNYFSGFGKGEYWDSHNFCLEKLVRISMHEFTGKRYEYDFLEFLFRVATSLRKITISPDSQAIFFPKEIFQRMEQLHQSFPHVKIVIS